MQIVWCWPLVSTRANYTILQPRYLLSDYHFGAKIVPFPPHQDEISSEDVEPLAEPGILHPAHDSNSQEELVTTGTLDNAIMMPLERVAT
jgi:hypothetical protein